jgi:signal transduction histidine kinase
VKVLLDHLRTIVPFDSASVMLLENKNQLIVSALRGSDELKNLGRFKAIQYDIGDFPILKTIIKDLHSLNIEDTSKYPDWKLPPSMEKVISWIGVPLIAGGQVVGLYSLSKTTSGFFTREYEELTEAFAAQATIAIQNAKLHKELQRYATELEKRVINRTTELAKRVSEVESLNSSMISLNDELKAAVIRAESADKLKSAFLATMSHELRTPLNSIIGFTGILLQKLVGPLSEEQEKQLNMVQGSARHLLELINDVLDISKIEAGQIDVIAEAFKMENAIQKSVEKIIPMADKKGLVLISTINPGSIEMFTDRRRVEQILINLLTNAVKFTDSGEVHLETHIENNNVVTRIIDTGIGIKPEDMAVLFKPFQQIDTGITRQYEGTGLGLSICKRLVELLGGKIWVESEWGKGSTFVFTLPLIKENV